MRYVVLASLGLVLGLAAGGCPPVSGRLDVNDHLRAACGGYLGSDATIEAAITAAEDGRVNGQTKSDMLSTLYDSCGLAASAGVYLSCVSCGTAILDQVFGE